MKSLELVHSVLQAALTDPSARTVCQACAQVFDDMRQEPGWVTWGLELLRFSRLDVRERSRVLLIILALIMAEDQGHTGLLPEDTGLEELVCLVRDLAGEKDLAVPAVWKIFSRAFDGGALEGIVSNGSLMDLWPSPLVYAGGRLQFRRTRDLEQQVVRMMEKRLGSVAQNAGPDPFERLKSTLDDHQKEIISAAHGRRCLFVSGGPGTGKTTCIHGLIQSIFALHPDQLPGRVAVTAPTGKAVFRVRESLRMAAFSRTGPADEAILAGVLEPVTLHRLLEYSPAAGRFFRHEKAPLEVDWVIVDESSMVDLHLACALLLALPETATLVWIGDREQLPSVGLGAVFSAYWEDGPGRFPGGFTRLEKKYRAGSGLVRDMAELLLSPARFPWKIREWDRPQGLVLHPVSTAEDFAGFLEGVFSRHYDDAYWEMTRDECPLDPDVTEITDSSLKEYLRNLWHRASAHPVLCTTHAGRFGTRMINGFFHRKAGGDSRFSPGEPVMMMVNDYSRKLWNGDFGVVIRTLHRGASSLGVCFVQEGLVRVFPLVNMPVERAFAFSVHKSQGSEFDSLSFVPGQPSPLLTRELVYTALTRARRTVHVAGSATGIAQALARKAIRHMNLDLL